MRKVLLTCLAIAMLSEFIKILGNIEIVPIVEPIVEQGKLIYRETGAYTPYLEAEHFPFELCSYQIIFILLALAVRNPRLQKRLYALMYTTCIAGAGMGILFSSAAIGLTGILSLLSTAHSSTCMSSARLPSWFPLNWWKAAIRSPKEIRWHA